MSALTKFVQNASSLLEEVGHVDLIAPAIVRLALNGSFTSKEQAKLWEFPKLKNVIESHLGGGTPSKSNPSFWDGEIPWASVKDIPEQMYFSETQGTITELGLQQSSSNIAPANSLVVVTRMGLGKVAINKVPVAINQDLRALILRPTMVPEFLYWVMKTYELKGQGLTVKGIRLEELLNIKVPCPPVEVQREVIASLGSIYSQLGELKGAIEKRNANIANFGKSTLRSTQLLAAEPLADALMKSVEMVSQNVLGLEALRQQIIESACFGKLNTNRADELVTPEIGACSIPSNSGSLDCPANWVHTNLGLAGSWGSGSTPARGNPTYFKGKTPWFKSGELVDSLNLTGSAEKISDEAIAGGSFRVNGPGDVLLAMYGATIGRVAILGERAVTNQAVCGCTPKNGLSPIFLYWYLKAIRPQLIGAAEGGAQPNISKIKIQKTAINIPPLEEQARISNLLNEVSGLIDRLILANQNISRLRSDAILALSKEALTLD